MYVLIYNKKASKYASSSVHHSRLNCLLYFELIFVFDQQIVGILSSSHVDGFHNYEIVAQHVGPLGRSIQPN